MNIWKAMMTMLLMAGLMVFPTGCAEEDEVNGESNGMDIRGSWQLFTSWQGGTANANAGTVNLSGEPRGGNVVLGSFGGTWNYSGNSFIMFLAVETHAQYAGTVVNNNRIEGTMSNNEPLSGTFYMTR